MVTDVHFAATLRYEADVNGDGDPFLFHELVSGPMSAGLAQPRAPDTTFAPKVLYLEGGFFNFGFASVDGSRLYYEVRDDQGRVRKGSELTIEAVK